MNTPSARPRVRESRSTCDPQYLQAGRVEPEWSANEVEVAPEGGGLRGRREADDLRGEPSPQRHQQSLPQRLFELEGNSALAEANLLACQSLAREGSCVACARAADSGDDEPHARRRHHAHDDR